MKLKPHIGTGFKISASRAKLKGRSAVGFSITYGGTDAVSNYRITEDNQTRVTEDGQTRILET